jgi:outer membrane protein TolC
MPTYQNCLCTLARRSFAVLVALAAWQLFPAAVPLSAQQASITLSQAVEQAVSKYPAIAASLEQVSAAAAGINLARTAYLPRADFLGQINRATRNSVFGLLLPQGVIPSISGPVLGTNNFTNVWGSAAGLLVSWEPFDFGLRRANVEAAESSRGRAEARAGVTRLQVGTGAADSFLTLLASQQVVIAARAGLERARVLYQVTDALAQNGLRPGADAARARAGVAFAETQLIQAEQAVDVARAALANLLGIPAAQTVVQPGPLLDAPPAAAPPAGALADHPLAHQQDAVVQETQALQRALQHSYYPRFFLQGSTYGRGSGARVDGTTGGPFSGFGPSVQNWAIGLTVTFPALDLPSIHAREQVQLHQERAAAAQYKRILQDLEMQFEQAQACLQGARRVAQNTPIELDAARTAEQQAAARYKSGLGNIVEVADATRLRTQAEIDDSLAKLGGWRALLGVAVAQGDLQPFIQMAGR